MIRFQTAPHSCYRLFLSVSLSMLAISCGKRVDLSASGGTVNAFPGSTSPDSGSNSSSDSGASGNPGSGTGNAPSCNLGQKVKWTFIQPQPPAVTPVDYLFVINTSCQMDNTRRRIAEEISEFVTTLDSNSDYRVSVMLAHGDQSQYSGRLYSACHSQAVLGPTTHSIDQIKTELKRNLEEVARDADLTNGEAMMSSLIRSLTPDRVQEIRDQGFYRKNAALSVTFVSNRNDICYPPQLHGYSLFPDYVPVNYEHDAYVKQCVTSDGQTPSITPESLYSALKVFQNQKPLVLGAITHSNPQNVPQNHWDSIGHGILELSQMDVNRVLIDSTTHDLSEELSPLSSTATGELRLMTEFQLNGAFNIDPTSLTTSVDGHQVKGLYHPTPRSLDLRLADAGHTGSVIEITACKVP